MMVSNERKKWILNQVRHTKQSDLPSFEFEDDSHERPKWLDELTLEELNWYGEWLDSITENEFKNMLMKE
ncbi:hypothetical protein [Levilactobacillus andaensis]|uniref:hypothetical protein n=1 Tax=Levilactobacillus andaensis TaxID=2799570 RepID=UPI0019456EC5|nr:hypothetical protein [Levilactobacillus andaensis]